MDSTHRALCEVNGCLYSYKCFGELFNVFVNGWPECDKKKAFNLVYSIANIKERLNKVLLAPATLLSHEADIRALLRNVFLEKSRCEKDYGFWLTMILKPLPLTYQSQVLYILTAPTDSNGMYVCICAWYLQCVSACVFVCMCVHRYMEYTMCLSVCIVMSSTGFVSWTQECGCSTLQHESCTVNFTELSKALMILHAVRTEWSEDDIISIIDEMTSKCLLP